MLLMMLGLWMSTPCRFPWPCTCFHPCVTCFHLERSVTFDLYVCVCAVGLEDSARLYINRRDADGFILFSIWIATLKAFVTSCSCLLLYSALILPLMMGKVYKTILLLLWVGMFTCFYRTLDKYLKITPHTRCKLLLLTIFFVTSHIMILSFVWSQYVKVMYPNPLTCRLLNQTLACWQTNCGVHLKCLLIISRLIKWTKTKQNPLASKINGSAIELRVFTSTSGWFDQPHSLLHSGGHERHVSWRHHTHACTQTHTHNT